MHLFKTLVAALAMVAIAACSLPAGRESAGEIIDDSVITTKVKSGLFNEGGFNSLEVSVETYEGNVLLSGFVNSQEDALKAEQIAASVEGVTDVDNELRVKQ